MVAIYLIRGKRIKLVATFLWFVFKEPENLYGAVYSTMQSPITLFISLISE